MEELWERQGFEGLASTAAWPVYDESKMVEDTISLAVQVSGKVRAQITVAADASDDEVVAAAMAEPRIAKIFENMTLIKSIVVKKRLVNLIGKPN